MDENEISKIVVDICYRLHKQYGPGLFETVYEEMVCYELEKIGIPFQRQCGIKVWHDGNDMGIGFRADIIVAKK